LLRRVACRLLNDLHVMTRTILIVDDDPAVLESYGRLLRRLGHRVILSADPQRVHDDEESLRGVDLLILDQKMPRTRGLALLASLRRRAIPAAGGNGSPCRPAVLLISASLDDEARREAGRLGVLEVIEKPVDASRLLASVRAALEGPSGPRQERPGECGGRSGGAPSP